MVHTAVICPPSAREHEIFPRLSVSMLAGMNKELTCTLFSLPVTWASPGVENLQASFETPSVMLQIQCSVTELVFA